MSAPAFCTQCASPLAPGAGFCTTCGAALAPTSTLSGPSLQPPPTAAAAASGLSAMSTGMGLAAKLGLAALAVGTAAGGTWLAVGSQNTRATPAAQTTQTAPGTPTTPAAPPEFTVSGPSAVPYGEPAVFTVTLNNTTDLTVQPWAITSNLGGIEAPGPGGNVSWTPSGPHLPPGGIENLEPGTSFTWTATFVTRLEIMDQYQFYFRLSAAYLDDDGSLIEEFPDIRIRVPLMLTIASPIRPLDSHWDDYCQLKKALYWAGEVEVTRRECKEGYDEADPTCWEDSEREYWEAMNAVLLHIQEIEDEQFSFVDEWGDEYKDRRFPTLSDQYACDCWCQANPEYVCDNIPWGTTADLPSYTPDPSENYVPSFPWDTSVTP